MSPTEGERRTEANPATTLEALMTFVDLEPAARRMAALVRGPGDDLTGPTPCAAYSVGDLLDHIEGLTLAFTAAAAKAHDAMAAEAAIGDAARLEPGWREWVPVHFDRLVEAWRRPEARTGMTKAGGIDLPGEVAAVVVLEELVVHGWDLARATGQAFDCGAIELDAVHALVEEFSGPDQADLRGSAYAAPITLPDTASALDRLIALTGRDPHWMPPGRA